MRVVADAAGVRDADAVVVVVAAADVFLFARVSSEVPTGQSRTGRPRRRARPGSAVGKYTHTKTHTKTNTQTHTNAHTNAHKHATREFTSIKTTNKKQYGGAPERRI